MKVLWFTNIPLDAVNRRMNRPTRGSGFWMHALLEPLIRSGEVELAVVTATAGDPAYRFSEGGVEYFNIPQNKILEAYQLLPESQRAKSLRHAAALIDEWKPDLIHVHGTERFFGLVRSRGLTRVPTIVSIQGLISECLPVAWGAMKWKDVLRNLTFHDLTRNSTPLAIARRFRQQAPLEHEILKSADAVIGRTDWDKAHAREANPKVRYFHVDEMMRPEFWSATPWSARSAEPRTIVSTSDAVPLKGLPILLDAVSTLKHWGHDVRLKIAGTTGSDSKKNGLVRFLLQRIRSLNIKSSVELLGWQGAPALAEQMLKSHCFVTPSFIENGSNSLSEAQLLGMPCVASHTGGMTTTIRHEETGLLFSRGDSGMLASQLERLFVDGSLADQLSVHARQHSRGRHDPATIVAALLHAYKMTAGNNG